MRSVFWLGHISGREGNRAVFSIKGVLGNTALARYLILNRRFAVDLMTHAIEEILSNANAIGVSAPLASYG